LFEMYLIARVAESKVNCPTPTPYYHVN